MIRFCFDSKMVRLRVRHLITESYPVLKRASLVPEIFFIVAYRSNSFHKISLLKQSLVPVFLLLTKLKTSLLSSTEIMNKIDST